MERKIFREIAHQHQSLAKTETCPEYQAYFHTTHLISKLKIILGFE